jgi:hypothetical protein
MSKLDEFEKELARRGLIEPTNGGNIMPKTNAKTVDVMGKDYVEKTDTLSILQDIENAPGGLLFGRAAYRALKTRFREIGLLNSAVETDPETGYYVRSTWTPPTNEFAIGVEYRVPLYMNSAGRMRNGNRLTAISA